MKKANEFSPNKANDLHPEPTNNNERECPQCGLLSLQGMPGGRDAVCSNCGYKDPCCYD